MKRLESVTSDWLTAGGIFPFLRSADAELPWSSSYDYGLGLEYYGNRSGGKYISPLLEKLLGASETISAEVSGTLAGIIVSMYGENWKRLWDAFYADYNPIENYNSKETKTGTETGVKTPTEWKETTTQTPTDWTLTETQTPNNWNTVSEGLASDNESVTEKEIYGFNSSSGSDSDKTTVSEKSKNTVTQNGTYETESVQSGTMETEVSHTGTFEDEMTYNTTIEKSGNIGVTTSQQMINSELELRMNNLFDRVFKDIDKVLTIGIY